MEAITTVGPDIAKSMVQIHGVDAATGIVISRQLRRRHVLAFFEKLAPCLVGIEACATSHHWSREIAALFGSKRSSTAPRRRRLAPRRVWPRRDAIDLALSSSGSSLPSAS